MTKLNSPPKVLFFGTPDFAVASLQALLKASIEVAAVITAPDRPAGRGRKIQTSAVKDCAIEHNLPVLQPEKLRDEDFLETLKSYQADLFIVVAFRMMPEEVWNMPPLGTINIHASLLPKYRGAAPIHWAIINGEKETGVTSFQLRQDIDTGPILLQKKIPILKEDTLESMYYKLMDLGAELLIETVNGLFNNTLEAQKQSWTEGTALAPKVNKETGAIDWNNTCEAIFNLVRGLYPFPATYTTFENETLKVYAVEPKTDASDKNPIGTMDSDKKTYIRYKAKDGWIHILEAQLPGKRRMKVDDLLRGYRWE